MTYLFRLMIKKILLLFFTFSLITFSFSQTPADTEKLVAEANTAYNQGEILQAAQLYEAAALNELALEDLRIDLIVNLLDGAYTAYYNVEEYEKSLECCEALVLIFENLDDTKGAYYAEKLNWLGQIYFKLKRWDESIETYSRVEPLIVSLLGAGDEEHLYTLNSLGMAYQNKQAFDKSIPVFQRLINLTKEKGEGQSNNYVKYLNNIAVSYTHLEKTDSAIYFYNEALAIAKTNIQKYPKTYSLLLENLIEQSNKVGGNTFLIPVLENEAQFIADKKNTDFNLIDLVYNTLGLAYQKEKEFDKAVPQFQKLIRISKEVFGTQSNYYATYLNNLGLTYSFLHKYDEALPLFLEAITIVKLDINVYIALYSSFIDNLTHLSNHVKKKGLVIEALESEVQFLEDKKITNINLNAKILNGLGLAYQSIQAYEKSVPIFQKLIGIVKEELGTESVLYAVYLNNLGLTYINLQEFDTALPLLMEGLGILKLDVNSNADNYMIFLSNLINLFDKSNNYTKGIAILKKEAQFLAEERISNQLLNALVYRGIGLMNKESQQFSEAFITFNESKEIFEKNEGTDSEDYGILLCDLADLYRVMGDLQNALKYCTLGIEIIEGSSVVNMNEMGVRYNNLALIYSALGQYDNAIESIQKSLTISENFYGKDHPEYNTIVSGLAMFYQKLGQYDKAFQLFNEVLTNIEKSNGKRNFYYLTALNNSANFYQTVENYDMAEELLIEALAIANDILQEEHTFRIVIMNNLALNYQKKKEYQKALSLQEDVVALTERTLGKTHTSYGLYINNLALTHLRLNEFNQASPLLKEAINILKKNSPDQYKTLVIHLTNLGLVQYKSKDFDGALNSYLESLSYLKKDIQQAFSLLSENEKENYTLSVFYNFELIKTFYHEYQKEKTLDFGPLYDIELIAKELVLSSSKEVREIILNSSDQDGKELYARWIQSKQMLSQQYALPSEKQLDIHQLELESENIEKQLIKKAYTIQTPRKIGQTNWKDIQNELNENEVAIEFVTSTPLNYDEYKFSDALFYAALVLRKNDKSPLLIPLFEQKQLDSLLTNSVGQHKSVNQLYRGMSELAIQHDSKKIYDVLWEPLKPYLKDGQTIYFSPSGTLHQIAFSAIVSPDGKYLSDIYRLKQLSTTAKLLTHSPSDVIEEVVLFGGINYDANLYQSDGHLTDSLQNIALSTPLPSDLSRGGEQWNYLKGTLDEVDSIKRIADASKIKIKEFTKNEAFEEAFKKLKEEDSPTIIHIATHGFFFPDAENKPEKDLLSEETSTVSFKQSDNPMFRSGLLFTGANKSWKGEVKKPTGDDGILTAYEVSYLSLNQTNLVVLSACETGLGEIKGSEGVFGLQRAFKAAGVNYLIMSLWKVPDAETAEFMTYFYTKLFDSKEVEESFLATQNYMKEKYPDNPYNWAAFVLVR